MTTKKQPRGSISVRGITYSRLQEHCDDLGVTISGFLENALSDELDAQGVPDPDPQEPSTPS